MKRFSTGCTLLDLVVGGGEGMGFPSGKMVNIVGDKSSGKTFLACELVAANHYAYKGKFKVNYDDGEEGFTFDTQSLYGINLITDDTYRSKKIQDFDVHVNKFLKSIGKDEAGIYVLDSLDGLTDETKEARAKEREDNYDKGKGAVNKSGTYSMEMQKFLSQEFFRDKCNKISDTDSLLVIVSQVRSNIDAGLFGKKYTRAGGKAMDFFAHTCLWLANVSRITKTVQGDERVVGIVVEANTDKSKTARPHRKCRFTFYFDYGIDNIGSNLDYLFNLRGKDGKLLQASKAIIWDGKPYNLENLKVWLEGKEFAGESLLEILREERKKEEGKGQLSLEWTKKWMEQADDSYKKDFEKEFGTPISRDVLINKISDDPKLEKELEKRVIDKWEGIEKAVKTNRKRKYL
jgi:recombination protein RecA